MADNLLDKASILLTPTAYDNGSMLSIKPENGDGDFDFERNSAATRVNAQGLVENVQIISSELVSNGNFSQIGTEEVLNGNFSQEGSELITNGDFATNSNWTLASGISYNSNGYIDFDGTQGGGDARNTPNITFVAGKTYKVVYEIKNYVSGTIRFRFQSGNNTIGQQQSGDGVKTEYIVCNDSSNTNFQFFNSPTFTGSIDNVSVKEVGQNWNLGSGWSIGDGEAVADNAPSGQSVVSGSGALTIGKQYKVSYEILSITQGEFGFTDQGQLIARSNQVGVVTEYFTALGGGIRIRAVGTTSGSITNISVKEVGQDWQLGTDVAIGDSVVEMNNSAALQGAIQTNVITSGNLCKVSFEVKNYVNGIVNLRHPLNENVSANGVYTFEGTANDTKVFIRGADTTNNFEVTNISLKEITDDTNIPRINYEGFSYQDSLGSELYDGNITQAVNGGTWIDNGDGTFTVTGNGTPSVGRGVRDFNADYLTIGKNYLITAIGDNLTIGIYDSSFGLLASGSSPLYFTPTTTTTKIYLSPTDGITATYSNVSVKEYSGQEVVPNSGCGSWLLEPQSTNLIPYSEDFSQWNVRNTSPILNYNTSPDGFNNSTRLVFSSSNIQFSHILPTVFTNATASMYVKGLDGETINFGVRDSEDLYVLNGDWQRIERSYTGTSQRMTVNTYNGATARDIEIWGAQLEALPYATSYIPTNGATNTRLQDIATNSGNSSLINSTEGVLYAEIAALADDGTSRMISLSDNDSSDHVRIYYTISTNKISVAVKSNGSNQYIFLNHDVTNITNFIKIAVKYKANDFSTFINGVKVNSQTTTASTPIGLSELAFDNGTGGNKLIGKVKALAVYKEALTDAELQSLTTI